MAEENLSQNIELNTPQETDELQNATANTEGDIDQQAHSQSGSQTPSKEMMTKEIQIEAHDHDGDGYPEHFVLKVKEIKANEAAPKQFCSDDVANRSARYLFITIIPILGVLLCFGKSDLNEILGLSILFMYLFYFVTITYYFCSARRKEGAYLFRVYTAARRVALPGVTSKSTGGEVGWAKLNVASHQQLYPLKPIHSISEFSAIDGAVPSVMLANLGQYTWAVVTLHFMMNIKFRAKYSWGFADTFTMIGASGLVLLGVFEADPFNKYLSIMHGVGAILGSGTVIGFVIQQNSFDDKNDNGNVIASFLVIFSVVFYILWTFNLRYCDKREAQKFKPLNAAEKVWFWIRCCGSVDSEPMIKIKDITREQKNEITKLSLINVIFEAIVLFCGSLALSLFIFYYNAVQNSYDYSDVEENPYYQDNGFYGTETYGDTYYGYEYYPSIAPGYGGGSGGSPSSPGTDFPTWDPISR